jgi:hypothetical protein
MAAVVNEYKCEWHFEVSGKRSGEHYVGYIQAADSKYDTLNNVLSSNSKLKNGTVVFDSVQEIAHGEAAIA